MKNWFTVEKIADETFMISEYGHYEQTHCYLLRGQSEALLIDTGMGVADIASVIKKLTTLPVTAVLTHAHWDHIGGLGGFARVGVGKQEASWLTNFPIPLVAVKASLTKNPCEFPAGFALPNYRLPLVKPTLAFSGGEKIMLGGRTVEVFHTPGHSPGHLCYYERQTGFLFSGDLVYKGKLDAFYPSTDPFAFKNSVVKMGKLVINEIYPGHFETPVNKDFLSKVEAAFLQLEKDNKLKHGAGILQFDQFSLHL